MTRKIEHIWAEKVDGIEFKIQSIKELQYDGKWDYVGYDVYWNEEGPHRFIGCPTDSDLRTLIKK
jgi:hypothetical protein